MIEFARQQFEGAKSVKGASNLGSLSDHLASLERQLGRPVAGAKAKEAELPDAFAHIWDWFYELASRRTTGMSGFNPISHMEVEAWARLRRIDVAPWEVRLLLQLDAVMLEVLRPDG